MPSGVMPTDWPDPSCDFAKRRTRRGEAGCGGGGGGGGDGDSLAVAMEGWCWYVSIDPSCFARCRTVELGEDELGVAVIRSDGDYSLVIVVVRWSVAMARVHFGWAGWDGRRDGM